jgi:hypothetical protein
MLLYLVDYLTDNYGTDANVTGCRQLRDPHLALPQPDGLVAERGATPTAST